MSSKEEKLSEQKTLNQKAQKTKEMYEESKSLSRRSAIQLLAENRNNTQCIEVVETCENFISIS